LKKPIISENAPKAVGPYSQAIQFGNMIFVSGQIPFTKEGILISSEIKEQTLQCLKNIESILKEAGFNKNDILKITIFLKDMNDFPLVNEVYGVFFEGIIFPARSTVEVARLPKDVKIEIEAIASI
jgi:2-iminobutanoate/2-iminopropanoate deaminase